MSRPPRKSLKLVTNTPLSSIRAAEKPQTNHHSPTDREWHLQFHVMDLTVLRDVNKMALEESLRLINFYHVIMCAPHPWLESMAPSMQVGSELPPWMHDHPDVASYVCILTSYYGLTLQKMWAEVNRILFKHGYDWHNDDQVLLSVQLKLSEENEKSAEYGKEIERMEGEIREIQSQLSDFTG